MRPKAFCALRQRGRTGHLLRDGVDDGVDVDHRLNIDVSE